MQRRIIAAGFDVRTAPRVVVAKANLEPRKSKMNKTERAYEQYLNALYKQGKIAYYKYEVITLKLGDDCRLTCDFFVLGPQGEVQFHDTKGFWKSKGKAHVEDDAKVKMVIAASSLFPFFEFRIVWQEAGVWKHKTY